MQEAVEAFGAGEGVAIGVAALLILALRFVLPAGERRLVVTPLVLLLLHVGAIALRGLVVADGAAHRALELTALALLLLSMGRSGLLLVIRTVRLRKGSRPMPRIFQDLLQAVVYAAAGLIVLRAAGVEPGSLLTTSALLTAVLGLSLQDTLGNMFAGLAIQAQRPFDRGDWIQYGDDPNRLGKVVEMNWRAVTVVTLERMEVVVPNSVLADTAILNFSKPTPLARREVFVWAPYGVPPHRVQEVLLSAIADVVGILAEPAPSVIVRDYTERGVQYWLRYFIGDFDRREIIAGEVRERIWYAMQRAGIPIPPPARRVAVEDVSAEKTERERQAAVDARERALRGVGFLADLPEASLRRLAELSEERLYAPGEVIIREGEVGHELYIIERGEVRVLADRAEHSVVEVARLGPGAFFGEISLMTGAPRKATVRAVGEAELIVLGKGALRPVLEEAPDLAAHISRKLAQREEELGARLSEKRHNTTASVEERSNVLLDGIRRFFGL
ncbi:MAG: cyclic nucleotide-binding domain-containing protein [Myxococcota bacterium]